MSFFICYESKDSCPKETSGINSNSRISFFIIIYYSPVGKPSHHFLLFLMLFLILTMVIMASTIKPSQISISFKSITLIYLKSVGNESIDREYVNKLYTIEFKDKLY